MNGFIQTANPIVRLLVLPTVTVLLATIIWNVFLKPPSLKIHDLDWDHWSEDLRYHVKVKNTGRTAAQNCEAELFVVIDTNPEGEDHNVVELERLHIPIGWLPLRQNTSLKPKRDDLLESLTISGKSSERIYLGFASGETAGFDFPPPMEEQEGAKGLKLHTNDSSDPYYQEIISRFLNKEEFIPTGHADMTNVVRRNQIGRFRWSSEKIVKAEIRVTADNASTAEATINLHGSSKERVRLPLKFYLSNLKGYFRAYVVWNYTYHNLKRSARLRWMKRFR
jgi:hypothetical protein